MSSNFDYLVIGSGIAGLTYAIKISQKFPNKSILVATKNEIDDTNTKYAQGGIAVVTDKIFDSAENHINDTLIAGDGMCNREIVEIVVNEGLDRINDLLDWGAQFDQSNAGIFNLHREGGHSKNRILHHKDSTGNELQKTLQTQIQKSKNIEIWPMHLAIDLLYSENRCQGAVFMNIEKKSIKYVHSSSTLLATGGIGQVFSHTTNPNISTGDGLTMSIRAGIEIENMEFIQFHPTALFEDKNKSEQVFLISEAVRGFGGKLMNDKGIHFMNSYDERADLAPRDIVSRSIVQELKNSSDKYVYLDCRHLDKKVFKHQFPTIYEKCVDMGIDLSNDPIPVVPAAHYSCGGIKTNKWGQTSMKNLFACGECASTGLHGANRLASNSLLEALVFAHRCYLVTEDADPNIKIPIPEPHLNIDYHPKNLESVSKLRKEVQNLMSSNIGVSCKQKSLLELNEQLKEYFKHIDDLMQKDGISKDSIEFRNIVQVCQLIADRSIKREQNAGVFFKEENV